jgi:hypothetical protein
MTEQNQFDVSKVIADATAVITTPAAYFQGMARSGGYVQPLLFVVVMAVAAGILAAVLSLFGASGGMMAAGFGAVIFAPIGAVIGSFVGAALVFVIWKLMGSEQNYETAYRCTAATAAIYPVVGVLAIIPYLGAIVGIVWASVLMIEASVAVHARERKTATLVFGILGALLILSNVSSEYAGRKMAGRMSEMGTQFEDMENLSPEEAGKKMGEFLKGFEKGKKDE